jgi:hypothetical protein
MTSFATTLVEVPVIAGVKMHMAAGRASVANTVGMSMKGISAASAANGAKVAYVTEKLYLRNREVFHEPWWGQAVVAEVLRYKLTYDAKAVSLGLNPLPLAQAVVASQYHLWGTMEVAETKVHDLFLCVRAYRLGVPRLRLFAAFLGDGRDLDEAVAQLLATPHALAVYLNILVEIHRELQRERAANLRTLEQQMAEGGTESSAFIDRYNVSEASVPVVASPGNTLFACLFVCLFVVSLCLFCRCYY